MVQVDQEHHIISETCQPMRRWHRDDKGKNIIDESVERLEEKGNTQGHLRGFAFCTFMLLLLVRFNFFMLLQ